VVAQVHLVLQEQVVAQVHQEALVLQVRMVHQVLVEPQELVV
jgi:hypothetical protein